MRVGFRRRGPMRSRLCHIKLLSLDVDGVLTDGRKFCSVDGVELVSFYTRDMFGIEWALECGLQVCVISRSRYEIASRRMAEIGVSEVSLGCIDKGNRLREIVSDLGLAREEVAHMGDDIGDLSAFDVAGMSVAPSDAHGVVWDAADFRTKARGGLGAIREFVDAVADAQDWPTGIKRL